MYLDSADTDVSGGAGFDRAFVNDAGSATLDLGASEFEQAYRRWRRGRAECLERHLERQAGGLRRRRRPDRRQRRRQSHRWRRRRHSDRRCAATTGCTSDSADAVVSGGAGYDRAFVSDARGATLDLGAGEIEEAYGDAGADVLDASSATSGVVLVGNGGADTLIGGSGNDRIYIDGADAVVSGGGGYDRVFVSDTGGVTVNLGASEIDEATGDAGADVLDASSATWGVVLDGVAGSDILTGSAGSDSLTGGAGQRHPDRRCRR